EPPDRRPGLCRVNGQSLAKDPSANNLISATGLGQPEPGRTHGLCKSYFMTSPKLGFVPLGSITQCGGHPVPTGAGDFYHVRRLRGQGENRDSPEFAANQGEGIDKGR